MIGFLGHMFLKMPLPSFYIEPRSGVMESVASQLSGHPSSPHYSVIDVICLPRSTFELLSS